MLLNIFHCCSEYQLPLLFSCNREFQGDLNGVWEVTCALAYGGSEVPSLACYLGLVSRININVV